jgi:hypothetical protein
MHRTARTLLPAVAVLLVLHASALAEEGGAGHYTPGANASFVDALPGKPGLALADFFVFYNASAGGRLPIAGLISVTLDAKVFANSLVGIYQTPLALLGGSYAFGGIVPVLWMDVTGTVAAGSGTRSAGDSSSGIGDLLLYPFMLGWTAAGGDLKYDFRFGIYAPTGKFEAGALANVGKNYWTFEPTATVSFISSKIGLEASAYAAVDFNTKNKTTDYQTGTQFHLDATLAEHVPLFAGFFGVGANAFYYQQIAGDSGSGATLGDFKGRTIGVGPVASYAMKLESTQLALELKWLPELETKNRLKGDYFWIKIGAVF